LKKATALVHRLDQNENTTIHAASVCQKRAVSRKRTCPRRSALQAGPGRNKQTTPHSTPGAGSARDRVVMHALRVPKTRLGDLVVAVFDDAAGDAVVA